jgi:hypothetical protein
MQIRAGSRLKSAVCDTEIMVVKAPAGEVDVTCGGSSMVEAAATVTDKPGPAADAAGGTQMGKRYVDADDTLEVLCTKPGAGSLGADGALLVLKENKPLPASD